MFGWVTEPTSRASRSKRSTKSLFAPSASETTLMATSRPSRVSLAR